MNFLISFSPALLGLAVVLQAGLNKRIAGQWGLSATVLLNAIVFAVVAALIYGLSIWKLDLFPENLRPLTSEKTVLWWYIVPGLLGCLLVFGGPWAIGKWGAVHTFIMIISAQLLGSLLWDWQVEAMSISPLRLAGIVLAWVGAVIVCMS